MAQLPQNQKPIRYIVPLNLAGPDYTTYSSNLNRQTCINWYPVMGGPDAKVPAALFPTHGAALVSAVGLGPHRGSIEHLGELYIVSGSRLVKMDTAEAFTTIPGNLATDTGRVSMESNGAFGNQILIVDGSQGYIFDGTTLAVTTDTDFPANPSIVKYMDGVAILTTLNTGKWYISNTNNFDSWNALKFANAERDRDNLVAPEVNNRDIMLFGEYTSEVGTNTGGFPFPFETYSNGLFDKGCAAKFSVAKADDFVHWLSKDRRGTVQVLKAKGIAYKIVSSKALGQTLSTYTTISDAEAFCYSEKGVTFYQLTFPTENVTWVYNTSIDNPEYAWFQKRTGVNKHLASTYTAFNNKQYVGSSSGPNLYRLDSSTYKDGEDYIIRERTSSSIHSEGSRNHLIHRKLELEFEAGTGLVSGQGSDPQVSVDWSDDGGHIWSNVRTRSVGKRGEYSGRVVLTGLGKSRNRIYRIRVSDPVKWVLIEGYLDVEETVT